MLIKRADDKTERIALLESLQGAPGLDARQREWARDALMQVRRGIEGERDAAHYLDSYLKDSPNHALLHDLRLDIEGEIAQIDHLLLDRTLSFYLLETKNFSGNLRVNEQGEFTVRYGGGQEYGIPSPIEQSRRHERVLGKALKLLGITGRMGTKPSFHHIVLIHPKAIITRPKGAQLDTSMIIKADQFRTWHERHVDKESTVVNAIVGLANVRGSSTIEEWGRLLARLHRPMDPPALPDFMKIRAAQAQALVPAAASPLAQARETGTDLRKKLVCATCHAKISFPEGKYCWGNERRFGGLQYCREHQAAFS